MKWGTLFSPVKIVTEAEAKSFIDSHETGSYQLVDVRMPEEYQQAHLPGARLVPLNELMAGQGDLNPELPTIVYCRSGGRSRAAAQWLSNQGFTEILDIGPNIASWLGIQLDGEYDFDLNLIRRDVAFDDAFALAYAMEEGLQQFYNQLDEAETRPELKAVYQRLAGFEDLHKGELLKKTPQAAEMDIDAMLARQGDVVEGGESNRLSPFQVVEKINAVHDIYSLALAIEAQSFDLYVRLADKAEDDDSRRLLLHMADEEKTHMGYISEIISAHVNQVA